MGQLKLPPLVTSREFSTEIDIKKKLRALAKQRKTVKIYSSVFVLFIEDMLCIRNTRNENIVPTAEYLYEMFYTSHKRRIRRQEENNRGRMKKLVHRTLFFGY